MQRARGWHLPVQFMHVQVSTRNIFVELKACTRHTGRHIEQTVDHCRVDINWKLRCLHCAHLFVCLGHLCRSSGDGAMS